MLFSTQMGSMIKMIETKKNWQAKKQQTQIERER